MRSSLSSPKLQIVARKGAKPAESPLSMHAVEDWMSHRGDAEALRLAYECGYRRAVALTITDLCRRVKRLEAADYRRAA